MSTNHISKRISQRTGFTIIEMVIYIAILAFILVAVFNLSIIIQNTRIKSVSIDLVNATSSRMVKTIDYLVRNSDGLVEDASGNQCFSSNALWLYFATSSNSMVPPGCMGAYQTGAVGIEHVSGGRVMFYCFQGYPNKGKAANCSHHPPSYATTSMDFVDWLRLNVYDGDVVFSTTTVGSKSAIETRVTVGFRSGGYALYAATSTASSTSIFRSSSTTAP